MNYSFYQFRCGCNTAVTVRRRLILSFVQNTLEQCAKVNVRTTMQKCSYYLASQAYVDPYIFHLEIFRKQLLWCTANVNEMVNGHDDNITWVQVSMDYLGNIHWLALHPSKQIAAKRQHYMPNLGRVLYSQPWDIVWWFDMWVSELEAIMDWNWCGIRFLSNDEVK